MKKTTLAIAFAALLGASTAANAADYKGWWWSAATDGMGLNVEQQGDTMAVAWYHFDEDRSPSYVILTGKPVDGVLSGELQTASGPPPGPGYNPANVARNAVGTATLTFKPSGPGSDQTTATLEYTLNGRSGSFELTRFAMKPAPFAGTWWFAGGGAATMENTRGNHYRWNEIYELNISGSGPVFTGSGHFSINGGLTVDTVEIKRLQVENGILIFDYITTILRRPGEAQASPRSFRETAIGFPVVLRGKGADFDQSGWWWDPSKDGMGVNIEQQGNTVAVAWYHFDEDRSPTYALLAGKFEYYTADELSGELQTASGPPPGPTYDPADVTRKTTGSATLRFTSPTSATFEYTLNGRSGSLDLSRFTMAQLPLAAGSWKYNAAYAGEGCTIVMSRSPWAHTASGIATLKKTGDKYYRLTTEDSNSTSCTYDLELTQSGSIFTGNGRGACVSPGGYSYAVDAIWVKRLQTENGGFAFNYAALDRESHRGIEGECWESLGSMEYGSLNGTLYDDANP